MRWWGACVVSGAQTAASGAGSLTRGGGVKAPGSCGRASDADGGGGRKLRPGDAGGGCAPGHEDERREGDSPESGGEDDCGDCAMAGAWAGRVSVEARAARGAMGGRGRRWRMERIRSRRSTLRFGEDRQTIVDAAFLALGLHQPGRSRCAMRCRRAVRAQLADALRATRKQQPPMNNWLLFAGEAMIEVALAMRLGEDWDRARVDDYCVEENERVVCGGCCVWRWAALSRGLLRLVCDASVHAGCARDGGRSGRWLEGDDGDGARAGDAICGDPGADDCAGWELSAGGAVAGIQVWSVSPAGG